MTGDHQLNGAAEERVSLLPTHIIWSAEVSLRSQHILSSWCAVLFLGFSGKGAKLSSKGRSLDLKRVWLIGEQRGVVSEL